jgi:hypothetical protein
MRLRMQCMRLRMQFMRASSAADDRNCCCREGEGGGGKECGRSARARARGAQQRFIYSGLVRAGGYTSVSSLAVRAVAREVIMAREVITKKKMPCGVTGGVPMTFNELGERLGCSFCCCGCCSYVEKLREGGLGGR